MLSCTESPANKQKQLCTLNPFLNSQGIQLTESPSARGDAMSEFPGNSLKAFIPNTDSWLSIQDIFSISSFQVIEPAEFPGNELTESPLAEVIPLQWV